jgi:hypothetical protein
MTVRQSSASALLIAAAIMGCIPNFAQAQVVPFKSKGTGIYSPWTGEETARGTGTHAGAIVGFGKVAVTPTGPLTATFESTVPHVLEAADGSRLLFDFSGEVELIPLTPDFSLFTAVWTGDFVLIGGTGRFANTSASEPLTMVAVNNPFSLLDPEWTFAWTLDGRIRLK